MSLSALLGGKLELVFMVVVGQPLLSEDSTESGKHGAREAGEEEVVDANSAR